jgi:hypothetical protein
MSELNTLLNLDVSQSLGEIEGNKILQILKDYPQKRYLVVIAINI